MRHWNLDTSTGMQSTQVLAPMIDQLGQPRFDTGLLEGLHPVLPAASWSVYRTGGNCRPTIFMSASHGVRDTTRDCWRAYLSGPHLNDRTLANADSTAVRSAPLLRHITADEVPAEHRARVYEAHGVAERLSIVQREESGAIFAINFYRHQHQRPFRDSQIGAFESLAPAILSLTRKQISLSAVSSLNPPSSEAVIGSAIGTANGTIAEFTERLVRIQPGLTPRELDVCARLLQGMTHEGIAADLALGVPTVKTYRNRAFARLGIHFRNEMFALMLDPRKSH